MENNKEEIAFIPIKIQESAMSVFNIDRETLLSKSKKNPIPDCRRVICYLIDKHTKLTQVKIMGYIGANERSAVYYIILIHAKNYLNLTASLLPRSFRLNRDWRGYAHKIVKARS
ncbi:helix-turn-helix domain-containing protein [Pedobacter sp. NJ-S-72]